jgi:hypothetical protein
MNKFLFSIFAFSILNISQSIGAEDNPSKTIVGNRDHAFYLLYHLGQAFPGIYQNALQKQCIEAAFNGTQLPKKCLSENADKSPRGLKATLSFGKVTCRSHASMSSVRRCFVGEHEERAVAGARGRNLLAALELVDASGEGATGKFFTYIWDITFQINFEEWQDGGAFVRFEAKTLDNN